MQAYDFLHLARTENCVLQIGGNDQWGNIQEGCLLIRRILQRESYGITLPLLTTASGEKLGKSVGIGSSVWLSEHRTSVFDFYQYFIRLDDQEVERYLRLFTFLPLDRIEAVLKEQGQQPELRPAQTLLAEQVTRFVHGDQALRRAQQSSELIYGRLKRQLPRTEEISDRSPRNEESDTRENDLTVALSDSSKVSLPRASLEGMNIVQLAYLAKVAPTKGMPSRLTSARLSIF